MSVYYNEIDPYAAQWLRNLIAAGHIAPGDVDERSIVDVRPGDLTGYTQCHFFAGIGGWSLALRLAGWSDDRPVWTGSCPCQPFSSAGKRAGTDDERHLWPNWFPLIVECRPAIIFGEQVAGAIKHGWLDLVFSDLEAEGYACGASVLPASSVGAPHIRQRLWFVADADGRDASTEELQRGGKQRQQQEGVRTVHMADADTAGELGDAGSEGLSQRERDGRIQREAMESRSRQAAFGGGDLGALANTGYEHTRRPAIPRQEAIGRPFGGVAGRNAWGDCAWLPCTDGKARPVKPGIQPLAHGVSARVGRLRAAGNAIVPQVAAEFIKAMPSGPLDADYVRRVHGITDEQWGAIPDRGA